MITPKDVLDWEYNTFEEFVNNPITIENDRYEFKRTYKAKAKEIRKDFSSFANFRGGFIFFGVDNNKNICGVEREDELTTYLNRALNNQCLQPCIEKWELIKAIRMPKINPEKYVYIYYIYPALFINKPHVSDGLIYIRQNGESKRINSGAEIRRQFFISRFYPEHIDQLEHDLESIRNYEYQGSGINALYFRYMELYLKELTMSSETETKIKAEALLSQYRIMSDIIDDINKHSAALHSATGIPPLSNPPDLKSKYEKLKEIVKYFITKYKGFHNL